MSFGRRAYGGYDTNTGGGNCTPALPAGWQVGDLHVLFYGADSVGNVMNAVGGWNPLYTPQAYPAGATDIMLAWRLAQAGDAAPTVTFPGGNTFARIAGYTGALSIITSAASLDRASTGPQTVVYPALTIPAADLLLIAAGRRLKTPSTNAATFGALANNTGFGAPVDYEIPSGTTFAAVYNDWIQGAAVNLVADGQSLNIADSSLNEQGVFVAIATSSGGGGGGGGENGAMMMMGMGS